MAVDVSQRVDVFVKVYPTSTMRTYLAQAVLERLAYYIEAGEARVLALVAAGSYLNGPAPEQRARGVECVRLYQKDYNLAAKQFAEDHAASPTYVVLDDDHLPLGRDWLSAGVQALEEHPDHVLLSSWSINGEVPLREPVGSVFHVGGSQGAPYFARRGMLGTLPAGQLESYDEVFTNHARTVGATGFLRYVRHNHLGYGYSQVVPGHWGA